MAAAGYSGTPLPKKLGIKEGHTVAILNEPDGLRDWLVPLPDDVRLRKSVGTDPDVVLLFAERRSLLERRIPALARAVFPDGAIWVGWPKKSSGVTTDITEDTVRDIVLPLDLVDVKVCAISDVWSGLRIVWRKERRAGPPP